MNGERLIETKAEMMRSLTALYLMLPEDVADHHRASVEAHIDAQAERIKALEARNAKGESGSDVVLCKDEADFFMKLNEDDEEVVAARQETATAIARQVTAGSIDRWEHDSPPADRWLLESKVLAICRVYGAELGRPDGPYMGLSPSSAATDHHPLKEDPNGQTVVGEVTPVGALAAAQERIQALEKTVATREATLEYYGVCPTCGTQGWYSSFDGQEQVQCQWCDEHENSLFNRAKREAEQAARIRELEADRASTLMTAIGALTDGDKDIRQETATAIARFVTTYAAETTNDAGQSVRVVGLEQILQVCRKHGATL